MIIIWLFLYPTVSCGVVSSKLKSLHVRNIGQSLWLSKPNPEFTDKKMSEPKIFLLLNNKSWWVRVSILRLSAGILMYSSVNFYCPVQCPARPERKTQRNISMIFVITSLNLAGLIRGDNIPIAGWCWPHSAPLPIRSEV